jgi:hypothetical protein
MSPSASDRTNVRRHERGALQALAAATTAIAAALSVACGAAGDDLAALGGKHVDDGSDLRQLTSELIKCVEYDDTKIAANLAEMPTNFMRDDTWKSTTLRRARNAMAGIPDSYLKWLYQVSANNGFYISQQALGGSVIGITYFSSLPQRIHISTQEWAADFALQHEVGHAMHVKLRKVQGFQSGLESGYQSESGNRKLRSYARSSSAEYFAESFNNFYCSPEAHAFLKAELPSTYDHLRKNLDKPRWEGDPVGPGTLDQDVWLKLLEAPQGTDATPFVASLPQTMATAGLCKGDLATCTSAARVDVRFAPAGQQPLAGRTVHTSLTGLYLAAGDVVTLLGFDASGKVVGARTVKAEAR